MMTPEEQIFLFGRVDPTMPTWWALDLTLGASMVFAGVCTLGIIVGCFDYLSWAFWLVFSLISSGVSNLILSPIHALVHGLRSNPGSVGPLQGLRIALHQVWVRLILCIMDSQVYCWGASLSEWMFPGDMSVMICRHIVSILSVQYGFNWFLRPAARYLSGFAEGLVSKTLEQSGHCFWGLYNGQGEQSAYCLGEEAGLQVKAIIEDDWGLVDLFNTGDIHHIFALVLVAIATLVFTAVVLAIAILTRWADRQNRNRLRAEAKLRDEARWQQVIDELQTTVLDHQRQLHDKDDVVAAKDEELRVAKETMKMMLAEIKILRAPRDDISWRLTDPRIAELQQKLEQVEKSLNAARLELTGTKEDATSREWSLEAKMASLEQQLSEKEQASGKSLSEIASLRATLETRSRTLASQTQQLEDIERRQAAAEARNEHFRHQLDTERRQFAIDRQQYVAHCQGLATEREIFVDRVNELTAQLQLVSGNYQQAAAEYEGLRSSYDELMGSIFENSEAGQERDRAVQQLAQLQHELNATKAAAETRITELQGSLHLADRQVSDARQTMHDLKASCDVTLEQESETNEELQTEIETLEKKLCMAMRDADRSHKKAEELSDVLKVTKHRLARYEPSNEGSTQEIPVRRSATLASVSAALEETRVTVTQQSAQIVELKKQLEAANKQRETNTSPSDEARQQIARLRRDLEGERRARTEDQVRWDRRTKELDEENRRLRISQSNNESGIFNRRGGRRG